MIPGTEPVGIVAAFREQERRHGTSPAYKEGMEKIDIEWVKKALGYPQSDPTRPDTCKHCGLGIADHGKGWANTKRIIPGVHDVGEHHFEQVLLPTEKKHSTPMGDVDIEITRDFKTITAHVEIAYFRRPEPSTYWINGDRGYAGEVVLGQACDKWGRELVLSEEEQRQAIEAFKSA